MVRNMSATIDVISASTYYPDYKIDNDTDFNNNFVNALDEYLPPFLIVTGTVCNLLVIKVMRSAYFRFISTSVFIGLTSGLDIFSLLILLSVHWVNVNFPEVIYRGENAHIMCKIFNFAGWGTSDLGILLTAAMTTERALAILFPMRAPKWCTVKRAKQVCTFIVFVIISKDFQFLITSDITPANRRDLLCFVSPTNSTFEIFWTRVWPWIHNGFLCVSFTIIIVSNCIILRYVRISDKIYNSKLSEIKQNICNTKQSPDQQQRGHLKRRQIAIILMTASFTIIVCTLPFSVFVTLEANISFLNDNMDQKQIKHTVSSLCFYLLYVNRCGNFFLYCISGTRFRKALKFILCTFNNDNKNYLSDNNELGSIRNTKRPGSSILSLSRDVHLVGKIATNKSDITIVSTKF